MKKHLSVLMMLALIGCSKGGDAPKETAPAQEETGVAEPTHKGGRQVEWYESFPKSLHYYAHPDAYSAQISNYVHVMLLHTNVHSLDLEPFLAKSWKEHDDHKTFTFELNPNATWFDGKPITTEDVKWTLETLFDPKKCAVCESIRSWVGPIQSIEVHSPTKITIKLERLHFDSAGRLGNGVYILPKHIYSKGHFIKDFNKVMPGGGAYVFDKKESKWRKRIVLKRRKNHWTMEYDWAKGEWNFDKITFKYIKDSTVAWESFKRKDFYTHYFDSSTIQFWDNQKGAPYNDPNLVTVDADRYNPSSWLGVALNMRKGPTKDLNFRKALQFLLDRETITKKILKGHYSPAIGPFMKGSKYSAAMKPIPYDPKRAAALLKKAGFTKAGKDGILFRMVDGKKERASLRVIYANEVHSPWLTMFKEIAKKQGVEIKPRMMEWSAATKLLDEFDFEGFTIGWTGGPTPGPEQLFHGNFATKNGSSNLPGLNDASINKLIDATPTEFNEPKRIKMYHEMERKIVDAQPYLFLWTKSHHYSVYWKDKVQPHGPAFRKFDGTNKRSPYTIHWKAANL